MTPLRLRDPDELGPVRSRYVKMMIHAATSGEPPRPSPMDAGLVLCDVLAGREVRRIEGPLSPRHVRDAAGHHQSFYPALLVHAWTLAARLRGDITSSERDVIWKLSNSIFDANGKTTGGLSYLAHGLWNERRPPQYLPASRGADIAADVWNSLADDGKLLITKWAGLPREWTISGPVSDAALSQQLDGRFLQFDGSNPEPWWYHELVILHAVATCAALYGKDWVAKAVPKAAHFHHAETQPDHATSQPWAIHAFLMDDETLPTADLMLLAAEVNQPQGLDAVSRILLADAAVCMLAAPGDNS